MSSRRSLPPLAAFVAATLACGPHTPRTGGTRPATAARSTEAAVLTGRDLVQRMHDRYSGSFYRTLSFLQNNTRFRPDGSEDRSQWMEYQRVPGRLRIEFLPLRDRSGILYRDGRSYTFTGGKLSSEQANVNPLLLLSADVYRQPVDSTIGALDSLHISLAAFRTDTLQGRRVYVVGAVAGDTSTSQFWVDAERLLLARLIDRQQGRRGPIVTDYRFERYDEIGGVPVPGRIVFIRGGKPFWREEYTEVKVNAELPDSLFDPTKWGGR